MDLKVGELKILLVIIRQTNGWINQHIEKRKTHDRIQRQAGHSPRSISQSHQKFVIQSLIAMSDYKGLPHLYNPHKERQS